MVDKRYEEIKREQQDDPEREREVQRLILMMDPVFVIGQKYNYRRRRTPIYDGCAHGGGGIV